jgi:hypothetical protein
MRSIDLSGKTALVTGVANHRSLAWAIAQALGDGRLPPRVHLPGGAPEGRRDRARVEVPGIARACLRRLEG